MNNHRLLTGVIVSILSGGGVCAFCQQEEVMTLEQLFEAAEITNTGIRISQQAQTEAQHQVSVAKNDRLPDINATLSLSYMGDGFTTKRNFSDYRKAPIPHFGDGFGVRLSQPVYSGGAISGSIALAEAKEASADWNAELVRDRVRLHLTETYLDIYEYSNVRKVVENNIAQAEKMLGDMNERHRQGVALYNDITRYELLLSDLNLSLIRIDDAIEILNHDLCITASLPENTRIIPDTTLLERAFPVTAELQWQEQAETLSPAIRIAGADIDICSRYEDLVRSERRPKVALQASWTIDGPILVEVPPINRNLSYWYVGIGVSYNLSSLFKSDRKLAASKASTRLANLRLEEARDQLSLDISARYIHYIESCKELDTKKKNVELATRNYDIVSMRYNAGMALVTELLDAANSRLDAEQRLVNARIDIVRNYYRLLFTTGKI